MTEKFEGLDAIEREVRGNEAQWAEPEANIVVRVRAEDDVAEVQTQVDALLDRLDNSDELEIRASYEYAQGPISELLSSDEEGLNYKIVPDVTGALKEEQLLSQGAVYMIGKKFVKAISKLERSTNGDRPVISLRDGDRMKWVTPSNYKCPRGLSGMWPESLDKAMLLDDLINRVINAPVFMGSEKFNLKAKHVRSKSASLDPDFPEESLKAYFNGADSLDATLRDALFLGKGELVLLSDLEIFATEEARTNLGANPKNSVVVCVNWQNIPGLGVKIRKVDCRKFEEGDLMLEVDGGRVVLNGDNLSTLDSMTPRIQLLSVINGDRQTDEAV